jgi:hypothetical protein
MVQISDCAEMSNTEVCKRTEFVTMKQPELYPAEDLFIQLRNVEDDLFVTVVPSKHNVRKLDNNNMSTRIICSFSFDGR